MRNTIITRLQTIGFGTTKDNGITVDCVNHRARTLAPSLGMRFCLKPMFVKCASIKRHFESAMAWLMWASTAPTVEPVGVVAGRPRPSYAACRAVVRA